MVFDVVLGTGFGRFLECENQGFGLTPPALTGFRWFSSCRSRHSKRRSLNSHRTAQYVQCTADNRDFIQKPPMPRQTERQKTQSLLQVYLALLATEAQVLGVLESEYSKSDYVCRKPR